LFKKIAAIAAWKYYALNKKINEISKRFLNKNNPGIRSKISSYQIKHLKPAYQNSVIYNALP